MVDILSNGFFGVGTNFLPGPVGVGKRGRVIHPKQHHLLLILSPTQHALRVDIHVTSWLADTGGRLSSSWANAYYQGNKTEKMAKKN